ncbi:hypothetical protein LZ30DRAFT_59056 [Colletotrichum cereale]|nr:hypothetical protein LZ30DRAFT_59056 [Colletotrichum cereale]
MLDEARPRNRHSALPHLAGPAGKWFRGGRLSSVGGGTWSKSQLQLSTDPIAHRQWRFPRSNRIPLPRHRTSSVQFANLWLSPSARISQAESSSLPLAGATQKTTYACASPVPEKQTRVRPCIRTSADRRSRPCWMLISGTWGGEGSRTGGVVRGGGGRLKGGWRSCTTVAVTLELRLQVRLGWEREQAEGKPGMGG